MLLNDNLEKLPIEYSIGTAIKIYLKRLLVLVFIILGNAIFFSILVNNFLLCVFFSILLIYQSLALYFELTRFKNFNSDKYKLFNQSISKLHGETFSLVYDFNLKIHSGNFIIKKEIYEEFIDSIFSLINTTKNEEKKEFDSTINETKNENEEEKEFNSIYNFIKKFQILNKKINNKEKKELDLIAFKIMELSTQHPLLYRVLFKITGQNNKINKIIDKYLSPWERILSFNVIMFDEKLLSEKRIFMSGLSKKVINIFIFIIKILTFPKRMLSNLTDDILSENEKK
jgi:hypothetical protein